MADRAFYPNGLAAHKVLFEGGGEGQKSGICNGFSFVSRPFPFFHSLLHFTRDICFRKSCSSLRRSPKCSRNSARRVSGLSSMSGRFSASVFQVRGVGFGLVLDQVVVEGPGVGVGVDGGVGVAEAFAVAEHFFQRAVVPVCEVLAECFQPRVVHAADALPAAAAREVGRFEVHGHAFAEPERDIGEAGLHAAVEGDLVRRFVNDRGDERRRGRLREHLVDLAHRAAAVARRRFASRRLRCR